MLNRWQITLQTAGDMNPRRGSVFHGWLMEQLPGDYAEYLHQSTLKPFSQFLFYDRDKCSWIWQVSTLNQEVSEIFKPIFAVPRPIGLNHTQQQIKMLAIDYQRQSYEELLRKHYLETDPERHMKIRLLTTTTFKVQQNYLIFPSLFHFYQSLMNRFHAFSENIKMEDEAVLHHLAEHTQIRDYRLSTQVFSVGKGRIKGFGGSLGLHCNGPETMVQLANLLFDYGNYAGIGIKTALGMGGVSYEKEKTTPQGDEGRNES